MKKGFTLAEVLITLGIIGIVAALTMPSLVAKYQKQQTLTTLKKNYAVLQEAFKLAEIENGKVNNWDWSNAEILLTEYLGKNLKIIKNYGITDVSTNSLCIAKGTPRPEYAQYSWLSGVGINSPFYANKTASVLLADGSCLGLNPNATNPLYNRYVFIDTNGPAKPNMAGKDLFFFMIDETGRLLPVGHNWSDEELTAEVNNTSVAGNSCNKKSLIGGLVCAERIIRDGWEINYF